MKLKLQLFFLFLSGYAFSESNYLEGVDSIKQMIDDPINSLNNQGRIVVLGNSALDDANIVLLPEIHDDPDSLLTQLLILSREKKRDGQFLVLDESLAPLKQSTWELFSQKTMEILAAQDFRAKGIPYAPSRFELNLKKIALKFRSLPGQLTYLHDEGIWSLDTFSPNATLFYGWDIAPRGRSLTDRNMQMVETLKSALTKNDRIFVMLGVRHVPELEYLSSQKLLCKKSRTKKISQYFSTINQKFGPKPHLHHGIGATLPIYEFLKDKRYAVVFSHKLYDELERVLKNLFTNKSGDSCFYIN